MSTIFHVTQVCEKCGRDSGRHIIEIMYGAKCIWCGETPVEIKSKEVVDQN